MRLAYTADLHGDIESYRSLFKLAVDSGAQAAIVGGDLLPHSIKLERALAVQQEFVREWLRPLLREFRQVNPSIEVYLLAGNDDWAAAVKGLAELEEEGLARPLHGRTFALESGNGSSAGWLAGYASVPITPFSIKDYEQRDDGPLPNYSYSMAYTSWSGAIEPLDGEELLSRPSIAEDLAALARTSDPARTVYVCHTPPANTPLDLMSNGRHVGSRALRSFIERCAPPLTLHGHIHEAPQMSGQYASRIGPTWCVNPGHNQAPFQAVTLDTDDIANTLQHTLYGRIASDG